MTLLYFGPLREVTGRDHDDLPDEITTIEGLWEWLLRCYPAIGSWQGRVQVAVDRRIVSGDAMFTAESEIALLPPVSGG